jgi:hypothetical protein
MRVGRGADVHRRWVVRIRTRLLVLAVLPAGVAGTFATTNAVDAQREAEIAAELTPAAETLAAINEANAAILADRFGSLGQAALRGVGIDPELTRELVGLDLQAVSAESRAVLLRADAGAGGAVLDE